MKTRSLFLPKVPIPRAVYVGLSACSVLAVLGLWCLLTYGGFTPPDFLATPGDVIAAGAQRIANLSLFGHIGASLEVILSGFLLASVLAVPIGILMGAFPAIQALFEPITGFMRYIPVSALIPLLILWIGIGLEQKIMVIFLGTFFQQLILISDVSARVNKDIIDCGYTLGASRRQVVWRILLPSCMPGVMDNLRVTMGWAWTYLVVAELVASDSGLGYMILNAMRGLFTDVILLGVFTIGILGLMTDFLFKWLRQRLLPWSVHQ